MSKPLTAEQYQAIVDGIARRQRQVDIAAQLGLAQSTISRVKSTLPDFEEKGRSSLRDANGELLQEWTKSRIRGRDPEDRVHLPDPKLVVSTSTLLDQSNRVTQQWVKEVPDKRNLEERWKIAAEQLGKSIKYKVPRRKLKAKTKFQKACVVIPIGDQHHGTSSAEGSGRWDLRRSEQVLGQSIDELLESTRPSEQCVIAVMGDFFHYDSLKPMTPRHGNLLDADGRFHDMVESGIRSLRHVVDRTLTKHKKVHVIISAGNHDEASSVFLRAALANIYSKEPRLSVDRSPKAVHVYEWYSNLIAVTHGDQVKLDKLSGVIAADYPQAWGRTKHRLGLTGHIHQRSSRELPGMRCESVGVLGPRDAYAESHGYRSDRSIVAIVLDPARGETQRHTITVEEPEK